MTMKHLMVIVLLAMATICQAQHLTFMGVRIDGSVVEVANAIEQKGFKVVKTATTQSCELSGIYAGEETKVTILATPLTHQVYRIILKRKPRSDWKQLITDYEMMFGIMVEEYNTPQKRKESFDEPYFDGDGKEMEAVSKGKCHYKATFQGEGGSVIVAITKNHSVTVQFDDATNNSLMKQEKEAQ